MESLKPILLVEDDSVDIMTVKRAFAEVKVANELLVARNGEDALSLLNCTDNDMPCIIFLDLNMYKMNGIEFLESIKSDDTFKKIPVVVITSSKEKQDKEDAFRLGVAGYMVKPVEYSKFVEIVSAINLYWSFSELPE